MSARLLACAFVGAVSLAACDPVRHHFLRQDHEFDPRVDWPAQVRAVAEASAADTWNEVLSRGNVFEIAALVVDDGGKSTDAQSESVPEEGLASATVEARATLAILDASVALAPGDLLLAAETLRADPPLLVAVTRDLVRVVEIGVLSSAELRAEMAALVPALERGGSPEWRADPRLVRLSALLLAPVQDLLRDGGRIIVTADDELAAFPLGALLVSGQAPGSARFLAETQRIRLLARLDCLWSAEPTTAPVFQVGVAFAQEAFPELLGLKDEIELVRTIFHDAKPYDVSTGDPVEFAAWTEGLRILHIGGHAKELVQDGEAGIALLRGSETRSEAFLSALSLPALGIRVPLVVLSACSTGAFGAGGWSRSLAGAFLLAGSEAVIATRWPINDRAAQKLMRDFYRRLGPEDPEEALASAIRSSIADPLFRDPRHWAGFYLAQGRSSR